MDGDDMELEALERAVLDPSAEPLNLTLSLLNRITNNFSTGREIGRGGFSVVYKGKLPNGLAIAVKSISQTIETDDRAFIDEITSTMRAKHKNTVRLIGYCADRRGELVRLNGEYEYVLAETIQRFICLEYVPMKILRQYITDEYHGLEWGKRYQIIKGICAGLRHLHETARIIHGDLKPDNILLEDENTPKIFDFGLSNYLNEEQSFISTGTIRGTPGYMAPEMLEGQLSFKSDIFALGVMITEFLTGSKQSDDNSINHLLIRWRNRFEKGWENKRQQVETCLDIGFKCMDADPHKRPTASEIMKQLDETETSNYSVSSDDAPIRQQGDEESVSSYSDVVEPEKAPSDHLSTYKPEQNLFGTLGSSGFYDVSEDEESESSDTDVMAPMAKEDDRDVMEPEKAPSDHHLSGDEEHDKQPDQQVLMTTLPVKPSCLKVKLEDGIPQGQAVGKPADEPGLVYKAQTSTNEHIRNKQDTMVTAASPADLSSLKFLEEITYTFSEKKVVGNRLASGLLQNVLVLVYTGKPIFLDGKETLVAVKRFIKVTVPHGKFEREAKFLKSLKHSNIVKLIGYYQDKSSGKMMVRYTEKQATTITKPEQLLCYEYVPNGSLRDNLFGQGRSEEVDWDTRYKLIKGICAGVEYLHEGDRIPKCEIVHLSLSLSKVLLDQDNVPRITGFDVPRLTGEKRNKNLTVTLGRPTTNMPPEYIHGEGELAKVDIYQLGIIILEIVTRKEMRDESFISCAEKWRDSKSHVESEYPSLDAALLDQVSLCISIGLDCVKIHPRDRPTAGDIMRNLEQGPKRPPSLPQDNTGGNEKSGNTTNAGPKKQGKKPGFLSGLPKPFRFQKKT